MLWLSNLEKPHKMRVVDKTISSKDGELKIKGDHYYFFKTWVMHMAFYPSESVRFDNGQPTETYKEGRFQITLNGPLIGVHAYAGLCEKF